MQTDLDLQQKSISQLVEIYNQAACVLDKPLVKRFRDHTTALNRTTALLNEARQKPGKAKRQKHFCFPKEGIIKNPRPNTLRADVLEALKEGTTFEKVVEMVKAFDHKRDKTPFNVERRAYEAIRLVHYELGFGLVQEEGLIKCVGAVNEE